LTTSFYRKNKTMRMSLLFALISAFLFACTDPSADDTANTQDQERNDTDTNDQATDNPDNTEVEEGLLSMNDLQLEDIVLPEGFRIDLYARIPNARSLALSPSGVLFVSNRSKDKVYAVVDTDGDLKANQSYVIAEDLRMPNGIAYRDGDLYVAEVSKLWRFAQIEDNLNNPSTPELIYNDYPTDGHHGWKYIAFGPDGKLYVPVGAPCNICESKDERYASITRMDPDGSNREVYAHGVRNTVGFTWHPETGEMWFTDNGRDNIGGDDVSYTDNNPPCELNRVTEAGQHFGYPYCHGDDISDPQFGHKRACNEFVKPAQNLGPHTAPLGMKFYTGNQFPAAYKHMIFIAEHGSWNRTQKIGYRVTMVKEVNGQGTSYEDFATGWLNEASQQAWGRPVDLVITEEGHMLLSDDYAGAIYRIWYEG
jgi:glucose/arabinose dehydrogenase